MLKPISPSKYGEDWSTKGACWTNERNSAHCGFYTFAFSIQIQTSAFLTVNLNK